MITIIPNLHPMLVHFTLALTITAFGTMLLAWLFKSVHWIHHEGLIVSRWCLWLAALAAIATVGAGFHAFYTVNHDAISHTVMKTHRNWALVSLAVLLLLAVYSLRRFMRKQDNTRGIFLGLFIAVVLVVTTGWYGAELVYRYGVGVISLPAAHERGHDHGSMDRTMEDAPAMTAMSHPDNHAH